MKKLLRIFVLVGLLAISGLALAAQTATQPIIIHGMLVRPSLTSSTFTFVLDRKTVTSISYLSEPDRVIVEFTNAKPKFAMHNAKLGGANVSKMDTRAMPNDEFQYIFYVTGRPTWKAGYLPPQKNEKGVRFELTITSPSEIKR